MAKRETKKRRRKTSVIGKIFKSIICFGLAIFAFGVIYSANVIAHAPKIDTTDIYRYLAESSILYDDDGEIITNVYSGDGNRVNLDYDEIPKNMVNAIVAIEDKTFWEHHGFNVIRIFGAIWESVTTGDDISGTSTITQQLARNVYLSDIKSVRSLNRKVTEAWYTVIIEKNLTKEQIIEAYLNTIYLGYNCYGIEAASEAYFSKHASDMQLCECIALASVPKNPNALAPIKTYTAKDFKEVSKNYKKKDVLRKTSDFVTVYNGRASKERRDLIAKFMYDQGYISEKKYNKTIKADLYKHIKLHEPSVASGYFTDFVINEVIDDLIDAGYSEEQARKMMYTGGLQIYTTLDSDAQRIIEKEFDNPYNFPSVAYYNNAQDYEGNILAKGSYNVVLYKKSTYIPDGVFTFRDGEIKVKSNGDVILYKGKRLNFYDTTSNGTSDISVELKPMYLVTDEGIFYVISSTHVNIPSEYKSYTKKGNVLIDHTFFDTYKDVLVKKNGNWTIPKSGYTLGQRVRQPQGAMVLCDNKTGAVKAMVGGREVTGELLYNRALSPRQPGSSIKPLSIYSTALQWGADAAKDGSPIAWEKKDKYEKTDKYGAYWTAASMINDAPLTRNGVVWPKNFYAGNRGLTSLRTSIEVSSNVNAVRVYNQVGPERASENLKKLGVTSVVTKGDVNDMNPAALALGGMTRGISPLEMASAYTTFPAMGIHREYTCYTEVRNSHGEVILKADPKETRVLDPGTAWIMQDILRTTVLRGTATGAQTWAQVTAGKTGTTTDMCDAWFCGFTPQYTGAIWLGNDVGLEMYEGSPAAARLWATIMNQVTDGMKGSFPEPPDDVVYYGGEYFVDGTQYGAVIMANENGWVEEKEITICKDSGFQATPWCTHTEKKTMKANEDAAKYYCPLHNKDTDKYKISKEEREKIKEEEKKKAEEEKKKAEEEKKQDDSKDDDSKKTTDDSKKSDDSGSKSDDSGDSDDN